MKGTTMSKILLPLAEAKAAEMVNEMKAALATYGEDDSRTLFWAEQAERYQRLESYLADRIGR